MPDRYDQVPLSFTEIPSRQMARNASEFNQLMQRRRTVREFSDRPVDLEIIHDCIRAPVRLRVAQINNRGTSPLCKVPILNSRFEELPKWKNKRSMQVARVKSGLMPFSRLEPMRASHIWKWPIFDCSFRPAVRRRKRPVLRETLLCKRISRDRDWAAHHRIASCRTRNFDAHARPHGFSQFDSWPSSK